MPKSNLDSVFKKSSGLTKLYRQKKLDDVISQFSKYITPQSYLGGSKCSAFLLPDSKHILKVSLKDIRYFRNGYCQQFMKSHRTTGDQVDFFQKHVNSLDYCFAPIKEVVYKDENIFIYIQDCCRPLKEQLLSTKIYDPAIIIQVLKIVKYMIGQNVLVVEIGPSNIGLIKSTSGKRKVVIFDYDTIKPLRHTIRDKPKGWWGFQLGSLLYYLSHVFCPQKTDWYRSRRHGWGTKFEDFKQTTRDFPSCVSKLIQSYTQTNSDIDGYIENLLSSFDLCIENIATS